MKRWKGRIMSYDVGEATEGLENEAEHLRHSSLSNPSVAFLRHSSFHNLSVASPTSPGEPPIIITFNLTAVASPTSWLIKRPFHRFTYVTVHYPILPSFHLRHSSFYNPSVASTTSQALHLRRLASRPW